MVQTDDVFYLEDMLGRDVADVEEADNLTYMARDALKERDFVTAGVNAGKAMVLYQKHGLHNHYNVVRNLIFSQVEKQIAIETAALAEEMGITLTPETVESLKFYTPTLSGMTKVTEEELEMRKKQLDDALLDYGRNIR